MRVNLAGILILLLISFSRSMVIADTIDLNDFYADPSVIVSTDGTYATMSEDSSLSTVLLSDDPSLGDPVILPSEPFVLSFNYEFSVAAENFDDFYVKLFDADTGSVIEDFFIQYDNSTGSESWSQAGSIVWSIAVGSSTTLGLEFQLNAIDDIEGSTVKISDGEFNLNSVPEPAAIFLFGLGLACLAYAGRENKFGLN